MVKFFKFNKKKDEKGSKREKLLLEEYNKGRILQVDNGLDNKKHFKSLEGDNGTEEVAE